MDFKIGLCALKERDGRVIFYIQPMNCSKFIAIYKEISHGILGFFFSIWLFVEKYNNFDMVGSLLTGSGKTYLFYKSISLILIPLDDKNS